MPDIPMGWATLIAAAVTAAGGVAAIVISIVLGTRTRRDVRHIASDAREVKEQVTNSHTTNLRDESDQRHAELIGESRATRNTLDAHGRHLEEIQRTQHGMQHDIGRLSERLTEIEKNSPRRANTNGES